MTHYDAFNGDADGICALVQHRLANPANSELITGVKRDITLLKRIQPQKGDHITVLDVAFEKNATEAERILETGATIFYADHHNPGELPEHSGLEADIDTSADTCTALHCTALIIDKRLNGAYRAWAITAAFGDNLTAVAKRLAAQSGFSTEETETMKQLGRCINYNSYGSSLEDLFFHPAELYRQIAPYKTPFEFIEQQPETFKTLTGGYRSDMAKAEALEPIETDDKGAIFILPNEQWARRVSGVYSNDLANQYPARAHAVLTEKADETYLVSIRAPLNNKTGADQLALQFPTGGGRKGAAGINALPKEQLESFKQAFNTQFR